MENGSGNALVPRDAKRVDRVLLAARGIDDQLARDFVRQKHGARLSLHHRAGILQDVLDQVVEAGAGEEIPRRQQQRAVTLLHSGIFHFELNWRT